ncbi:MAG: type II toxin-antitoxin system Phd/YefM family antitoxin [Spirochaetes bacterium]|nr:type II toxin-antitoxin system Phd/YefM family antitoxin [Spirochaetota bacterium]
MNIAEDIRPISYIKAHAAEILNQLSESRRPVYITQNGEAKAVLVDADSFERMQKTILTLKIIAQGENDIRNKRYREHDSFFEQLEKDFDDKYSV